LFILTYCAPEAEANNAHFMRGRRRYIVPVIDPLPNVAHQLLRLELQPEVTIL
jgi:hypothetical protein